MAHEPERQPEMPPDQEPETGSSGAEDRAGPAGRLTPPPAGLIGQTLGLSFSGYLLDAAAPCVLGLAATWLVFRPKTRGTWEPGEGMAADDAPTFNPWQTSKGLAVILVVVVLFLFTNLPRELVAVGGAGLLLMSRKMSTRSMLALVDWHLLVLFGGLFVVNHAMKSSGNLAFLMKELGRTGIQLGDPAPLFVSTVVLSNLVSNVPATMLLLPIAKHPLAGPILALSSTFAGNLFIVGSIANIIVVEQAARMKVRITWSEHARACVPLTLMTLLFAAGWLWLRAAASG